MAKLTPQQERDARLGFSALSLLGSIPPGPPPVPGKPCTVWCGTCGARLAVPADRDGTALIREHMCYPGVTDRLIGGDGNAFSIIGAVSRALTPRQLSLKPFEVTVQVPNLGRLPVGGRHTTVMP